jgi:hypothetical protein
MLACRRLFAGKDDRETLRNVLLMDVPPPSAFRAGLPIVLDRIVLCALERRRELRYATADELARDCDRVLEALPADDRTLRAFLGDLFTDESSASQLEAPELAFPPPDGVPIALPDPAAAPRRPGRRARWVGAALLAATALLSLGVARQRQVSATQPAATLRVPSTAPWSPIIVPLAARLEGAAAPVAASEPEATRATGDRRRVTHKRRLGSRARHDRPPLSADLTLNPF